MHQLQPSPGMAPEVADTRGRVLEVDDAVHLEVLLVGELAVVAAPSPDPDHKLFCGEAGVHLDGVVGLLVDTEVKGRPLDQDPLLDAGQGELKLLQNSAW